MQCKIYNDTDFYQPNNQEVDANSADGELHLG